MSETGNNQPIKMSRIFASLSLVVGAINLFTGKVHCFSNNFFTPDEFNDYSHEGEHNYIHFPEDNWKNSVNGKNDVSTLVLSHVIFRHGNRTPDGFQELYPNDPYLNETYYPYGLGQLTNAGKLREYNIGTSLRRRYKSFLSDIFISEEVEAITTDYNRTKASLMLALAGLFPPRAEQVWNNALMWQPVPYNFLPRDQDRLLMGVQCPNYLRLYEKVANSLNMTTEYKKFRKVFNYVSRHSGLNVTKFQDIYNLYFGLSTEEENGLILPDWTQKVWPEMVTRISIKEYYVMMASNDLRRMASGYLLRKILDDSFRKISQPNDRRKIYLYSAHENNVAQFLMLLDIFKPHIPNYGAHVILEVHMINGVYGMKIFYQNYDTNEPLLLKIPNCGEFCIIDKFVQLFGEYVPEDDGLCGN